MVESAVGESIRPQVSKQYAQVLVDIDVKSLDKRTFTYSVPEEFQDDIDIGVPVLVSFGRMPKVNGFVVGFTSTLSETFSVKEITEILDETPLFTLEYLQFLDWVSDYYAAPLTQVISCALPSNLLQKTRKEVRLTERASLMLDVARLPREAQRLVGFLLEKSTGYTPQYLSSQLRMPYKTLHKTLASLKQQNFVEIVTQVKGAQGPKTVKQVSISPGFEGVLSIDAEEKTVFTKRQRQILDYLQEHQGVAKMKELLESLETTTPTVMKLQQMGVITIEDVVLTRDPLAYYAQLALKQKYSLSEAQEAAVNAVMAGDSIEPYLLYGVTGSGKTEVYMTLTEKMLRAGKSVLMLLPEIALTSQISKRFIERFGIDEIALWHSNLSAGEKADTWRRVASGDLRIVIGARSAVFTPLVDLGVIMIDEEHDGSFKQDSPVPRYNAKVLAQELARRSGAKILYGSATPDPSSFYAATHAHRLLPLPERFGGRSLAAVELVDMKQEKSHGNKGTLSRRLKEEIALTLERKEQTIILINRRGFFTLVVCTECEHTFMCPHCTVALTVHRAKKLVRCHYCGHEESIPVFCPKCASGELTQTGTGSQRVEDEIAVLYPEARILRLDSDIMQRKEAYREIFEAFATGEADILVGTQMVAKGLDIPNVTLVGVISADASFYLPDYKSSERGFQLLTQVAGRAGRGAKAGKVVVQSVDPNHAVIQFAQAQDYLGFYQYEMESRRELSFPPFSQLFRLIVSGMDEFQAQHFIKAMAMNLLAFIETEGLSSQVQLLGPAPCVVSRIQGRYRFHCLLKNLAGPAIHRLINSFYKSVTPPEEINFILDVEPQSLL